MMVFLKDILESSNMLIKKKIYAKLQGFSPFIDIVLMFFSYSSPLGILGSDGKQNTA